MSNKLKEKDNTNNNLTNKDNRKNNLTEEKIEIVDEEIDRIFEELDEEYGISGFKDEYEIKEKIRELDLNRESIVKWIEESLLNN